jgi:hypothetical protein
LVHLGSKAKAKWRNFFIAKKGDYWVVQPDNPNREITTEIEPIYIKIIEN